MLFNEMDNNKSGRITKNLAKPFLSVFLFLTLTTGILVSQELYTVTRVIDGDTIQLNTGEKVRLIGINTPETKHPAKPVEYYGKEATVFTKRMVEGKRVRLEYDVQKRDKYGRLLAYVYLQTGEVNTSEVITSLNAELVKQGYANVATYPPNVKYANEFIRLEREARENHRGLWSNPGSEQYTIQKSTQNGILYVTKSGTKYHRSGCKYLKKTQIPISFESVKGRYSPCNFCNPAR